MANEKKNMSVASAFIIFASLCQMFKCAIHPSSSDKGCQFQVRDTRVSDYHDHRNVQYFLSCTLAILCKFCCEFQQRVQSKYLIFSIYFLVLDSGPSVCVCDFKVLFQSPSSAKATYHSTYMHLQFEFLPQITFALEIYRENDECLSN